METAQGILSVVTANMAKAIRVISVQRGYDPRDYALMAFGGAGPLHAARLARNSTSSAFSCRARPASLCALGLLLTDLRSDFAITRLLPLEDRCARCGRGRAFAGPRNAGRGVVRERKDRGRPPPVTRTADMRYQGQNYELSVPLPAGPIGAETLAALAAGFRAAHSSASASSPRASRYSW
jgi:N-methylhydantoinase A